MAPNTNKPAPPYSPPPVLNLRHLVRGIIRSKIAGMPYCSMLAFVFGLRDILVKGVLQHQVRIQ